MKDIEEVLASSESGRIVLTTSSAEKIGDVNCELVRKISLCGYRTIVITVNNPAPLLKDLYKSEGIDISKVFFVDAITKYALGSLPGDIDNSIFVSNPGNLTDIGIGITEMLKENPGEKTCVILDSVNTMLIYLPTPTLTKFIHFLSSKLRLMRSFGFYIAVKEGLDPMLLMQLKTFSDETVEI
ncbi:hypothetical protein F1737_00385 [Methanoplanus sp. FWC-SCC4]|uniref:KaiC-like domain-containing protein n=1 Tax=Methanochimaera problematica TaxID=2609417 RepID=A0AA97FAZ8_9EURY|nr:hypothetical protein [Methanoplanus sp. FWC-SCC4]WOF15242.1 hypothetical protein F1737_00385 [Methanoplanus sp. FWC-SCC4]